MELELPYHNITILDFNELFITKYQVEILDCLFKFKLLDKSLSNPDVKKLLYHNLIHGVCETLLEHKKGKPVLLFKYTELEDCLLCNYHSEQEILEFLRKFIVKLEKMLPIRVCQSTFGVASLKHIISKNNDSRAAMVINQCIQRSTSVDMNAYTFQKIKTFTKKYELTFLNNDYFNRLKTKQILI